MKNVLVLTYWSFRSGLVQAYTLPYLRMVVKRLEPRGRLTLVTLEQDGQRLAPDEQLRALRELGEERIDWAPFRYRRFGAAAMLSMSLNLLRLYWTCRKKRIEVIHCFCMPAGAIGCMLSLATGIPLIIDSYEPHAEAMVEAGVWSRDGLAFRILHFLEGVLSRRAAAIVATAPGMREYGRSRYGAEFVRFFVKPACVDMAHFRREGLETESLRLEHGLAGKVVCVYAGKTGGTYLDKEIFDLFKVASAHWPGRFRALFLSSDSPERISELCRLSDFDPRELVHLFVDHREIPRFMALADFALTPVRPVPMKKLCTPIKNGEYWAMGLPVVSTAGIASDSDLIVERRMGAILHSLDEEGYREALTQISHLLKSENRVSLGSRIRAVAEETRSMAVAEAVYDRVYGRPAEE